MKWLKAFLLASVLLLAWTATLFVVVPVHRLVFRITPTTLTSRDTIDRSIVAYLFDGKPAELGALTTEEQAHMADVRSVWLWLAGLSLVGLVWIGWARPIDVRWETLGLLFTFGVLTLVGFIPAFELMHRVVFPGGNWSFPDQSLLIQTYPIGFFVWMWGIIVTMSGVSLVLSGRQVQRSRV